MSKTPQQLIRFDWASKRMFRSKASFGVLEGFLSTLLNDKIKILKILEGESNKMHPKDKQNRVDMLVENSKGEYIIIEIQNSREWDFVSRILYGTSKVITENIVEGEAYLNVKKVICVSILYFDIGQGSDYIYVGKTKFIGLNQKDELLLNENERILYKDKRTVADIYPEYYLIKVNQFDEKAKTPLDEWVHFLKTDKIQPNFTAPGLKEARRVLDVSNLSDDEFIEYRGHLKDLHYEASTLELERKLGEIKGEARGKIIGKNEGTNYFHQIDSL